MGVILVSKNYRLKLLIESVKKSRLDDDSSALLNGVSEYLILRDTILENVRELTHSSSIHLINGWANSTARNKLLKELRQLESITKVKFQRRLRFDLPPLFGGRSLFWGFQIEISIYPPGDEKRISEITKFLEEILENINFSSPKYLCVDTVKVKTKRFVDAIDFEVFTSNLDLIIDVIEATCDFEVANTLINSRLFEKLSVASKSKIFLISDEKIWPEGAVSAHKYTKVGIQKPEWQVEEHYQDEIIRPELVSGKFGYESLPGSLTLPTLPSSWIKISNCEISGLGILLAEGKLIDDDPVHNPSRGFVAGRWPKVIGSSSKLDQAVLVDFIEPYFHVSDAISLLNRVPNNYYHWLIETLPRLLILEKLVSPSIPLLVPKQIHSTSLEALKLITDRELIFLENNQVISVTNCFIPGPVIFHSDSTITNWADELKINTKVIELFRNQILSALRENVPNVLCSDKIFVQRGMKFRGLMNQKSIALLAIKSGYEVIDPIELSFLEQVKLFSAAKEIITCGGAVMSNFLFCSSDTKIANIYSEQISDYPTPAVLASISGAKYVSLESVSMATTIEEFLRDKHHRHSVLNQAKFKKFLKKFSSN